MKFNRKKNAKRNIFFGVILRVLSVLFPFLIRTLIIHFLGAEYVGLNSLFSSILSVLSVAELGFGSAIVFSMYKPIAEDNKIVICAILNFYRKVYRIIGTIILTVGILLIPFLERLIKGTVPNDVNLVFLYLIYLFNTCFTYFFFGYLNSLVTAYQRDDLISKVNIVFSSVMYIVQGIILMTAKNYNIYIVIMPFFTIINNFYLRFISKKMFPEIVCKGNISKDLQESIKNKMKGLVIAKVGGVSRNAFDSIFISMFLGLTEVAVYSNYFYIINAITGIMVVIVTSISSVVGNSIVVDTREKNFKDLSKMNFVYMWLSGWFTICLFVLYQPFMQLWVGESLMLSLGVMSCFCLYFYVMKLGDIQSIYITAAGLFWEFRYSAIWQAILNIVLNYLLGKHFGIPGILFATILSIVFVDFLYGNRIVFKFYFKNNKEKHYYLSHLKYFVCTLLNLIIVYTISSLIEFQNVFGFVIKLLICGIIPNIMYLLIYHRSTIYKDSISWVLDIVGVKNSFIKKILFIAEQEM